MSGRTTIKHLERHAIQAHARGIGWNDFWHQHGAAVCAAEPHSRERFQRFVRRLLALVVAGNEDGAEPAGEPWLLDEQQEAAPSDTITAARIDWTTAGIAQEVTP